jgi:hypothetical protein
VTDDFDQFLADIEELRAVLPVGREYQRTSGGRFIVASVEVWVEMLVVRCAELGQTANDGVPSLRDDQGTRYAFAGGGGAGTEHLRLTSFVFRPSLDPLATKLWLEPDDEQRFEIALPPRQMQT